MGYIKQCREELAALGLVDFSCLKYINLLNKAKTGLKRLYGPHLKPSTLTDKKLLGLTQNNYSESEALARHISQRKSPHFLFEHHNRNIYVKLARRNYPDSTKRTIAKADQVCKHVFDLLGYPGQKFSKDIEWKSDLRFGVSWNDYYLNINCAGLGKPSDMRISWELSRFQHFISLGRAYWYTGDEKYAREFVRQLQSWWEANPLEWGSNWTCAMEAAMRAISWIRAYYFFLDSPAFTIDIQIGLIKSLIQHGKYIQSNLEGNPYGRFGNHYMANGLGLFCLGLFLSDFKVGPKWLARGLDILWRQTEKQIYPDGVDYEQSIDYHRQVLEILLLAIQLCRLNHIAVPPAIEKRVIKMLEFVLAYIRPDGSTPMIGDADNGWLWSQGDNGHLACLAAGAMLFEKPGFKSTSKLPEASFWLLGIDSLKAFDSVAVKEKRLIKSKAYDQAGFYIMRHKDIHLTLHCSKYGLHGHNDILGFDLFAQEQHFIADPGTYTYSGSLKWRKHFISASSHNTIRVDEQEFHRLAENALWVDEENQYKIISWESSAEYDFFDAEHYCYHRLADKVTHRRQVLFVKQAGYFIINDILSGGGKHEIEIIFNLAPTQVELSPAGVLKSSNNKGAYMLIIPDTNQQLEAKLTDSWISYVYGAKQATKKMVYSKQLELPTELFTIIATGNAAEIQAPETIEGAARKAWKQFTLHPAAK